MDSKAYEDLKKKYSLPDFASLDKDFHVSDIDAESGFMRAIRDKISEKVKNITELLEHIMQPDSSISVYFETRVFDEASKKEIFEVYKILMSIIRESNILYLVNDEQQDAQFIIKTYKEWQTLCTRIMPILIQLKESWGLAPDLPDKLSYLG